MFCLKTLLFHLLPRSANSTDNARLDIKADGFWGCDRQSAYFDVRIFNPTAHACRSKPLSTCYRRHKMEKRRHCEDRVQHVEHGSFTPLIFSTAGGFGPSTMVVFKRFASLLSNQQDTHYNKIISWMRCKIGFALNRSAVMCLRGTRSRRSPSDFSNIDLALIEGRVTT